MPSSELLSPSTRNRVNNDSHPQSEQVGCAPACDGRLIDIRHKFVCLQCRTICETCCEGGRG